MKNHFFPLLPLATGLIFYGCKPAPTEHVVMHGGETIVFKVDDPQKLKLDFAREPSELAALKLWAYYSSIGDEKKAKAWFAHVERLKKQSRAETAEPKTSA